MQSRDVLHNFSVPAFRLRQDAVPGRTINGWFKPTKTGTYDLQCAEMCGYGHGIMGAAITVHTEENYNESLLVAEGNNDGKSILFALSGLLENFILSESYEKCEEIFNKIDENQESIEKNAIQYSKDAVDASLEKLKQEVPKNQFDSEIKKVKNILSKQPENKG